MPRVAGEVRVTAVLSASATYLPLAFGFSDVGGGEIVVIGVIALLLFGKSLPSVSRNLGRALAEFKRTISQASSEIHKEMEAAAESVDTATQELKKDDTLAGVGQEIKDALEEPTPSATPPEAAPAPAPAAAASTAEPAPVDSQRAAAAVSAAAALDELARNLPPPSKIPPPVV